MSYRIEPGRNHSDILQTPYHEWQPLTPVDPHHGIFSANPRALNQLEINKVLDAMISKSAKEQDVFTQVRDLNQKALYRSNGRVSVVLDGRARSKTGDPRITEGYLGDIIEASATIQPLVDAGLDITIFTPHTGTITSQGLPNLQIVGLPTHIPHIPHYPWTTELLAFTQQHNPETPIFFPLNAATPLLVTSSTNGTITNQEQLEQIRFWQYGKPGIVNQDLEYGRPIIKEAAWSAQDIHQLQALQINLDLLGIPLQENTLPPPYLKPSSIAQEHAAALVNTLFSEIKVPEGTHPLFIHTGVATGGMKVASKYYPPGKWEEFFAALQTANLPITSSIFFIPSDRQQAQEVQIVAKYAKDAGLQTAFVPEHALASQYGWSFGTFIAFLQELSKKDSIVLGCDSMPVHAAGATGNKTVVIGNKTFNPNFYAPRHATIALPLNGLYTRDVEPDQIIRALQKAINSQ